MDRPDFPRWTILNFVEQLAEGSPMPGGGCAVSVMGALAAALGSLSGQISLKKEADPGQKDLLAAMQPQIDQAQQEFLELIDADALAYHKVVLARRLPQETAAKREVRGGIDIAPEYIPTELFDKRAVEKTRWSFTTSLL